MEKDQIVSTLREVNEFVNDGERGYRQAAKDTKNEQLQNLFNEFAEQRKTFSEEINQEIIKHGGEPEATGTAKGSIFRQWMDVKNSITGKSDKDLIKSSRYGEEWAQKAYNDAITTEGLPEDVKEMLIRQQDASQKAYMELEKLEEVRVES